MQLPKIAFLFAVLIASISSSSFATSPGECPTEPRAAFADADAVVLAKVTSIKSTPWTPETATEPTIIQLKILRHWKLHQHELPRIIHASTPAKFSARGTYLLFLKKREGAEGLYRPALCAPTAQISGDELHAIDSILSLSGREMTYVD